MEKFNVYVMIGIPGSGKTTWIKNNLPLNFPVISRDVLRKKICGFNENQKNIGNKEQEEEVTKQENEFIDKMCLKKASFAVDDMNTQIYRKSLIEKLKSYNAKIIAVVMKTPLNICIERRKNEINSDIIKYLHKSQIPLEKNEIDEIINVEYKNNDHIDN